MPLYEAVRGVRNVADLVHLSALARPDAIALIDGDVTTTWAVLDHTVTALAAGLLRMGHAPGERVAICLGNSAAFVATYFGVLRAGLVAVPLNTSYTAYELDGLIAAATPTLVVAESVTADAVRQAGVEVVVVGEASYDAIVKAGTRADAVAPDPAAFEPARLAVLLFTAGTSGPPKGAMLTHRALLANIGQLLAIDARPVLATDVVLVVLPLFHVYGLNAVLGTAVAVGAACVLLDRFDPVETPRLVRERGVTNIAGAPPMFVAWSALEDLDLGQVRILVSGAAPLAPAVSAALKDAIGLPVWEGYGLTEAAPVVTSTLVSERATPGSVGTELTGVEIRLIDDLGAEADEGDPGEVHIRGDNLFSGYWPDGADGPDADGWWATGDVAFRDVAGDLHLVDRRRDLILVSGFNVYPYEVEHVLNSHPSVAEAAVVGVPDAETGNHVVGYVVAMHGHDVTDDEILAFARTRLARFKVPRVVHIVESLPHTSTGKVQRARLKAEAGGAPGAVEDT